MFKGLHGRFFERRILKRTWCPPDDSEHSGEVLDISASGLAILAAAQTKIGDNVVLYIDEIGGFKGTVKRQIEGGFALEFDMGAAKRGRTVVDVHRVIVIEPQDEQRARITGRRTSPAIVARSSPP